MPDPGRFFSDGRFTRRTALRYGGAAGAALAGVDRRRAAAAGRQRAGAAVLRGARQPARPEPPGRRGQRSAAVRPRRRRDDGEPLLRQPARRARALGPAEGARAALRLRRQRAQQQPRRRAARAACAPSRCPTTAQAPSVTQTWNATHEQINGGKMNGFVESVGNDEPMGYWTEDVLPFAYSFARSFTLANRWFCSAPCQTYPNRRFLMAGDGLRRHRHRQRKPARPAAAQRHDLRPPADLRRQLAQLLHRPAADGDHPVDRREIPGEPRAHRAVLRRLQNRQPAVGQLRRPGVRRAHRTSADRSPRCRSSRRSRGVLEHDRRRRGDRQDMSYGESWAYSVVDAVLNSPAWPRTLLIYTYDEHGGYYDHVKPPAAIAPDAIAPRLRPRRRARRL